ncbi:urea amidolyase family protein [Pseudoglutamicibacter cumminsii]|uniref:5-oxoprolinase subunit B/C family protein n=1 Tax=Pseudoglutamicibacter cumminsii TaxID=156979 RepID=UPI0026F298BD|nr:urea amidolyase family protein [Pseudoglutamicibacter cumminsii]
MSGPGAALGAVASPRMMRVGFSGLLLEFDDTASRMAWNREIQRDPVHGMVDSVMAAESILLTFVDPVALMLAGMSLQGRDPEPLAEDAARLVTIPVVYDGEDLAHAAELAGLSVDALIDAHTRIDWLADFAGFAPGFMYLKPRDLKGAPVIEVPRRDSPRTRVPEGSVALAGQQSAVYPQPTPGGWQLIGSTAERMWDVDREQPSLLVPGDTVRFEAVREHATVTSAGAGADVDAVAADDTDVADDVVARIVVDATGPQALIQDVGRPAVGSLGVGQAGAADVWGLAEANNAVGNHAGAAAVEFLLGNAKFTAQDDVTLALGGAVGPAQIMQDGKPVGEAPVGEAFELAAGATLQIGFTTEGMRGYLAVKGGFAAEEVLGSRSTDTMSGLGPKPLAAGDVLGVLAPADGGAEEQTDDVIEPVKYPIAGEVTVLRYSPGPRDDWFGPEGLEHFEEAVWEVSTESNRVGARLKPADGAEPLKRIRSGELATEGMVTGALQVPPNGEPVLFLADHPVTGGYPVIGVVLEADIRLAAQLPPGSLVQFERVSGV